jgi:hypothetical protein
MQTPVSAFGRSLSFFVTRDARRLAVMRRAAATAREQGDLATAQLIEANITRVSASSQITPELPSFVVGAACRG